ncbi:MAG: beta-lactamase family protein [Candidatus Eremiobacteraeota bacterium]|nr:beta-lactamase family protein [Candidatus Eremiobacteraeota bacterium]
MKASPERKALHGLDGVGSTAQHALGTIYSAAVVHIRLDGDVVFEEAFGARRPGAPATAPDCLFDLASITKLFTTTALLALFDRRRFALDDPITVVMPEFAGTDARRAQVSYRHLLTHTSGLPAYANYREESGPAAIIARICATPLVSRPGSEVLYSDLGFMLAGALIERIWGAPLDQALHELVASPMQLSDLCFRPEPQLLRQVVCTENDPRRKRLLRGEVHDENAWAMGGAAGHAGLFGSAEAVADLAEMYRRGGPAPEPVLMRPTARAATRLQADGAERRGLGWALHGPGSSCGDLLSPEAYGHTGYTGTSVWVDPQRALTVVLLTNRVHVSRDPEPIRQFRIAMHDAVVHDLERGGAFAKRGGAFSG